ncbi:MAG TPA: NADH-quinone oxidoreductase subunit J [Firmicutes bacterium]|nr:NADH-quinone oxidoreductase subunit J [Bacillota bacterium]
MVWAFWLVAAIIIVSALGVVGFANLIHSALALAATFLAVAILYLFLAAEFVAAMQVLIYIGAVAVLIVFGIMVINRSGMQLSNPSGKTVLGAFVVAIVTMAVLLLGILNHNWPVTQQNPPDDTIAVMADLVFNRFLIPFEIAGLLLLVSVIGAILLAREVRQR